MVALAKQNSDARFQSQGGTFGAQKRCLTFAAARLSQPHEGAKRTMAQRNVANIQAFMA
jgi:hypothetical protein